VNSTHCIGPLPVQYLPRVLSQVPIGCVSIVLAAAQATKRILCALLQFFLIDSGGSTWRLGGVLRIFVLDYSTNGIRVIDQYDRLDATGI
jgi:hypothetical protein